MSVSTQSVPVATPTATTAVAAPTWLERAGYFVSLTKPRLSSLVLFVVFLGTWLAGGGPATWHAVIATALVAVDEQFGVQPSNDWPPKGQCGVAK